MVRKSAVFVSVLGLSAGLLSAPTPAFPQVFSRGNALVNQSAVALDSKNWRAGTALAEEAIHSNEVTMENIPAAYNNFCVGLTGLRKFDEAMQACDKAVQMKPRAWEFYNNRANIYFYLGQFDRALAEYYKAMTFSSTSAVLIGNIEISLKYRKQYGPRPGSNAAREKSS